MADEIGCTQIMAISSYNYKIIQKKFSEMEDNHNDQTKFKFKFKYSVCEIKQSEAQSKLFKMKYFNFSAYILNDMFSYIKCKICQKIIAFKKLKLHLNCNIKCNKCNKSYSLVLKFCRKIYFKKQKNKCMIIKSMEIDKFVARIQLLYKFRRFFRPNYEIKSLNDVLIVLLLIKRNFIFNTISYSINDLGLDLLSLQNINNLLMNSHSIKSFLFIQKYYQIKEKIEERLQDEINKLLYIIFSEDFSSTLKFELSALGDQNLLKLIENNIGIINPNAAPKFRLVIKSPIEPSKMEDYINLNLVKLGLLRFKILQIKNIENAGNPGNPGNFFHKYTESLISLNLQKLIRVFITNEYLKFDQVQNLMEISLNWSYLQLYLDYSLFLKSIEIIQQSFLLNDQFLNLMITDRYNFQEYFRGYGEKNVCNNCFKNETQNNSLIIRSNIKTTNSFQEEKNELILDMILLIIEKKRNLKGLFLEGLPIINFPIFWKKWRKCLKINSQYQLEALSISGSKITSNSDILPYKNQQILNKLSYLKFCDFNFNGLNFFNKKLIHFFTSEPIIKTICFHKCTINVFNMHNLIQLICQFNPYLKIACLPEIKNINHQDGLQYIKLFNYNYLQNFSENFSQLKEKFILSLPQWQIESIFSETTKIADFEQMYNLKKEKARIIEISSKNRKEIEKNSNTIKFLNEEYKFNCIFQIIKVLNPLNLKLNLGNYFINDLNCRYIHFLICNTSLLMIYLDNNYITDTGSLVISNAIAERKHIDILSLKKNFITHIGIRQIFECIKKEYLKRFHGFFSNLIYKKDSIDLLIEIIFYRKRKIFKIQNQKYLENDYLPLLFEKITEEPLFIQYIDLSGINLNNEGFSHICMSIYRADFENLKSISANNNNISDQGLSKIQDLVDYYQTIEKLSLNFNRISDHGCKLICDSIHYSIKYLGLAENYISRHGYNIVLEFLLKYPKIEFYGFFSISNLLTGGFKDFEIFGERTNKTSKFKPFKNNYHKIFIPNKFRFYKKINSNEIIWKTFGEDMKKVNYFKTLDLSNNIFDPTSIKMISDSVRLINLDKLILNSCQINDDICQEISKMVYNSMIKKLSLANNNIRDTGAIELRNIFSPNSLLQAINLSRNFISDEGFKLFFEIAINSYEMKKIIIKKNSLKNPSLFVGKLPKFIF